MIEKIIEYSARNRVIVLMFFGLIIAWGVWSVYKTPVDAIPDLSDNQVIVFSDKLTAGEFTSAARAKEIGLYHQVVEAT